MKNFRALAGVLVLASLGACHCDRGKVSSAFGDFRLKEEAGNGSRIVRDASYTLGPVAMGARTERSVAVVNLGNASLTLKSAVREEGAEAFELLFNEGQVVTPQQEAEVTLRFSAPQESDPTLAQVSHRALFRLQASGTAPGEESVSLQVEASAVASDCQLPKTLDFGLLPLGETFTLDWKVDNSTALPVTASVDGFSGTDSSFFGFDVGGPAGSRSIAANESTIWRLNFTPVEERVYTTQLSARRAEHCPSGLITLLGEGSSSYLGFQPAVLDFGRVALGQNATRVVTFVNHSSGDIALRAFEVSHADYGAEAAEPLVVPARGTVQLALHCTPSGLGPRPAQLSWDVGLSTPQRRSMPLTCWGGGPRIQGAPTALSYGQVPLHLGLAPAYSVPKKLVVLNVGNAPNGDLASNLHLGRVLQGQSGQLPLVSVRALNSNTAADEFSVSLPTSYDPALGIEAVAGRNFAEFEVRLTPKSLGLKEAELVVYSNDGAEPELKVPMAANVIFPGNCQLDIRPPQINFGDLPQGTSVLGKVDLINLGSAPGDGCIVSNIELAAGSDAAFSLLTTAPSLTVPPNGVASISVRATAGATGAAPAIGFLRFATTARARALVVVPLAVRANVCLVAVPNPVKFGNIKQGCRSPGRQLALYNACAAAITLLSASLDVSKPEFFLAMSPAIPVGGLTMAPGGMPVAFGIRYGPVDLNTDEGHLALTTQEGTRNLSYEVELHGTGAVDGKQQDSFVQTGSPQTDILFTIDNSCSMSDEQGSLGANFQSFISQASLRNVDYHLAVTTTDDSAAGAQGRFVAPPGEPLVLNNSTPSLDAAFAKRVRVGTVGSGTERPVAASLKALTEPLLSSTHQGFLRSDATLAVIVVSDAIDQSPNSISYYLSRLQDVKGLDRPHLFTFSVVGPFDSTPPADCFYDSRSDDGRYQTLIDATKGIEAEICSSNWSSKLSDLGARAFGFPTRFGLSASPDLTQAFDVRVNGIPVIGWTYDAVSNSLNFTPALTPKANQTLTVGYTTLCL